LRALHLANGGAVIGLLTFYGNIAAQGKASTIAVDRLALALNLFAWGLTAGLVTSALGYLSQLIVATCEGSHWETRLRHTAIACAAISIGLFVAGTYQAGSRSPPRQPPPPQRPLRLSLPSRQQAPYQSQRCPPRGSQSKRRATDRLSQVRPMKP
jgi:hypothetical protein